MLLEMTGESVERYGAPRHMTLTYVFPRDTAPVQVTLQWFDRQACRLPEALWLSFVPVVAADGQ